MADQWYGEPVHERVRVVLKSVSAAGRTVPANVEDGPSADRDMHDMWRLRYGHGERKEHGEEGSHTGRDHGSGEDESTGRERSEPSGNETRSWCTIQ